MWRASVGDELAQPSPAHASWPSTTWAGAATLPAVAELALAAVPASTPQMILCIMLANPSMSRSAAQDFSCIMLAIHSASRYRMPR